MIRTSAPIGRRTFVALASAAAAAPALALARRLAGLGWRRGRDLETRVHQGAGHAFAETAVQMDELLAWLLA